MAEAKKNKFFKSTRHAGQKFLVKTDGVDPTLNEYVKFTVVREKYQGDTRNVGYLKTDDSKLAERVAKASGVVEVTDKEYYKVFPSQKED